MSQVDLNKLGKIILQVDNTGLPISNVPLDDLINLREIFDYLVKLVDPNSTHLSIYELQIIFPNLTNKEISTIFDKINSSSKQISFNEFYCFYQSLDKETQLEILNCLILIPNLVEEEYEKEEEDRVVEEEGKDSLDEIELDDSLYQTPPNSPVNDKIMTNRPPHNLFAPLLDWFSKLLSST